PYAVMPFLPVAAKLGGVLLLTLISAFFVATEYALVTIRKTRIDQLATEGNRAARAVRRTLDELSTLLAATQLGVTMVSLGLGALAEPTVARLLDPLLNRLPGPLSKATLESVSVAIAFLAITALDIIVGELAPKTIGLQHNERVALITVRPIRIFIWVFRPFIELLEAGGSAVARVAGSSDHPGRQAAHSPEELKMLVMASTSAGILDPDEEEMLIRVFQFSRLSARQIMVPRTELVAVPADASYRELLAISARDRHTRLPVYEGTLDNIIGIAYLRDILHQRERIEAGSFDLRTIMREALLVPETIRIDDLLRAMRQGRIQIAIAIDEFGGTAGLVTLEDLLERIVGEVQDEFEPAATEMELFQDGTALIDGLTLIDDVNSRFGLHLDDRSYDTIGGYVFGELGRRAVVGDTIPVEGRTLEVTALDGLRIAQIRLRPALPPEMNKAV
ncbi:MAG: hemolysin family protein, partial [Dehalococcoidia bacterium]